MDEEARRTLRFMEDLPDEDIALRLQERRVRLALDREIVAGIEAILLRRLEERDAKEVVAGNYILTKHEPATRVEWDTKALQLIRPFLTSDEWEQLVWPETKTTWHVETNRVLALARRRGAEFQAFVTTAQSRVPMGNPTISIREVEPETYPRECTRN